jgi:hypothetical protein
LQARGVFVDAFLSYDAARLELPAALGVRSGDSVMPTAFEVLRFPHDWDLTNVFLDAVGPEGNLPRFRHIACPVWNT